MQLRRARKTASKKNMKNMKKLLFTLVAVALSVGCSRPDSVVPVVDDGASVTIEAALAVTSTSYADGLTSGYWNGGDQLGVYVCRTIGDEAVPTIDNLLYYNSLNELSSVARFTATSRFNVTEADTIYGYYPYSSDQNISVDATFPGDGGSRSAVPAPIVRPFTLPAEQVQCGNDSAGHIGALDFLVATPVAVSAEMLASAPDIVVPFTFRHAFAALKVVVRNGFVRPFRVGSIALRAASDIALTGDYGVDIVTPAVVTVNPLPNVKVNLCEHPYTAVGESLTAYMMVNATTLPAGTTVEVATSEGVASVQTASDISLSRGAVTSLAVTLDSDRLSGAQTVALSTLLGNWKLTSYCGAAADVDIYMTLNADNSFMLYQRDSHSNLVTLSGVWFYDSDTGLVSGVYSDGTAWASGYYALGADADTLTWVSSENAAEVSVYTRSEIPGVTVGGVTRAAAGDMKRFL